jgi:hypothetical protein
MKTYFFNSAIRRENNTGLQGAKPYVTKTKRITSVYYFWKVHLHHFSKTKSQKESQNSRNQGFLYYFCMMIERSGSIPLTNGSGSGSRRLKNIGTDPTIKTFVFPILHNVLVRTQSLLYFLFESRIRGGNAHACWPRFISQLATSTARFFCPLPLNRKDPG